MSYHYSQDVSAESEPIIVAMVRGDVDDKKSMTDLFQKFLTDDDYILPILGDDWDYIQELPGHRMASAGSLDELEHKIEKFKDKVDWVVYDLEPGSPPEELDDYVNSVKKAYELAHSNNLKLLLTPAFQDIKKYDSQFAPYVDMVNLQIPHFIKNYEDAVENAVNNIKEVNPNAIVTVQLIPIGEIRKTNGNPDEIIKAWNSVKDKVDGVFVFYFRDPDPIPILEEVYDNLGRNTISVSNGILGKQNTTDSSSNNTASKQNTTDSASNNTASKQNTTDSKSPEGGGCLIATASYGSELAPQVQQLREMRNSMLQTNSGNSFMNTFNNFYYFFSPQIADYERQNPVFKEAVRLGITPMISSLSLLNYVNMDSEERVLGYGISLILLNVGIYFAVPITMVWQIKKRL